MTFFINTAELIFFEENYTLLKIYSLNVTFCTLPDCEFSFKKQTFYQNGQMFCFFFFSVCFV